MTAASFLLHASPAEVFEVGANGLAPLLSSPARARILRGAGAFPLPARTLCLECRLNEDDRVDLALCLATHTAGLTAALESLGQSFANDVAWRRCMRLLLSWVRSEDAALAAVPFLYTAFDLGADAATMPVPCLSLCADASFFMQRLGLPVPRASRGSLLRLLDACRDLLEADWMGGLRERVQHCAFASEDLEVRQLSLMLARRPATLKLDVTLPVASLGGFLAATGWRGSVGELLSRLRWLAPWQQRVQLNYVVNPGSDEAPLEVELCCTGPQEPSLQERLELLDKLVASGLATTGKAGALGELLRQPVVERNGHWVGRNWYLKLRFDAGRFTEAKAYIGLMQRTVSAPLAAAAQRSHDQ